MLTCVCACACVCVCARVCVYMCVCACMECERGVQPLNNVAQQWVQKRNAAFSAQLQHVWCRSGVLSVYDYDMERMGFARQSYRAKLSTPQDSDFRVVCTTVIHYYLQGCRIRAGFQNYLVSFWGGGCKVTNILYGPTFIPLITQHWSAWACKQGCFQSNKKKRVKHAPHN